ncbi:hypothetical protein SARC_07349 [Sphaeroforma arctica JP610]|uniref:Enoyl reductase (ER) domain-containing protein n=1 Tax=Sphaeroforma arctica JP610 TaxID=667725 RepID=A0A0L0FUE9_9EUKA|nr:hypothetical protein SARC_07349 [Sphaeroforma arctica JP610]KNC80284.1 hypothetical protein SARC_07349 [Sphaeroforma arctica JP610]|eukprot:XP_014154186.1 hypothetical protein SARC_07349 [Sphaeroforma arctica JP610]
MFRTSLTAMRLNGTMRLAQRPISYTACRIHEFGGPDVMKIEKCELPDLKYGQVVVDIKSAGINPAETYIRSGIYHLLPELPYTPGKDGSGVVAHVGDGVEGLSAGDRVYVEDSITGTYADKAVCEAKHVHALPENLSFQQGSALGIPYGTAYRALKLRAHLSSGERLLINGASGGVGLAAVQLAVGYGATVVGIAGSSKGCEAVLKQGAAACFLRDDTDLTTKIRDVMPDGADVILEMRANKHLSTDIDLVARHGRIVVVGNQATSEHSINPRALMVNESSVIGCNYWISSEKDLQATNEAIGLALRNGTAKPTVGEVYSLENVQKAHEAIVSPTRTASGKMVLTME